MNNVPKPIRSNGIYSLRLDSRGIRKSQFYYTQKKKKKDTETSVSSLRNLSDFRSKQRSNAKFDRSNQGV